MRLGRGDINTPIPCVMLSTGGPVMVGVQDRRTECWYLSAVGANTNTHTHTHTKHTHTYTHTHFEQEQKQEAL